MLMGNTVLAAEVEIDETYVGGKERTRQPYRVL